MLKPLSLYRCVALLLTLLLGACQQPLLKTADKEDQAAGMELPAAKPLPFKSAFIPAKHLTEEMIYHYLVAEISIQRQQLDLAYEHFILAASLANDKDAAEKAARIALLQKQADEAMYATAKWIGFDPNSIHARQLGAILHLRDNDLKAAEEQLDALLKITGSQGSNGYLRIASLLASEKDKQRNLLLMQTLTAGHPQNAQAHYGLALVEFEAKQFPKAMHSLEQAKALDPFWDKPYILEAQILTAQGKNLAAQTSLEKAVGVLPEKRSLHQAHGRILVENKQYQEAIEAFKKAYELEPTDLDLLYAIGMLAMQAEDWKTARNSWNKLLTSESRGKRDDANYFLGQLEELNNNPDKAMQHYMAVGKGKTRTESRLRLARLMAEAGQLEEARALYRELRVLNHHGAVQIYAAEAQTLKGLGLLEQALELYTSALSAYPESLDLRYARGLYAADNGDIELAVADFEVILAAEPENADALNALGYTLADQTDRYQEALDYILKAYQLKPDNSAILDSLGWVLYRLGKYEEALKYLHKAATANPDAEIAAHLGEVLWMLGNRSEAKEIWNHALTTQPESKKLKEVMQRLQSP